jgi:hypothetical protein
MKQWGKQDRADQKIKNFGKGSPARLLSVRANPLNRGFNRAIVRNGQDKALFIRHLPPLNRPNPESGEIGTSGEQYSIRSD